MSLILNVEISNKIGSLDTYFKWDNIPMFSVIAGINGAGKTKLLHTIFTACNQYPQQRTHAILKPESNLTGLVRYVPINHTFDDIGQDATGTSHHIENRNRSLLNYIKAGRKPNNPDFNYAINEIEKKHHTPIETLIENNIVNVFCPELSQYIEDGFSNRFIAEIFKAYELKVTEIQASCFKDPVKREEIRSEEEVYSIIGYQPPWVVINNLFAKYDFVYRITEPKCNISYIPEFVEVGKSNLESVQFKDLSSGEKIIVTLILWAYNQHMGNKIKLLLLDEFDAHLNPSMIKMFIEVVKDKFVREFGIQVIMTTHIPSTVAHIHDDDLFWMERRNNIKKATKNEIIPILSNGIMTYQEASGLLECIAGSTKDIMLITEGPTDVHHLGIASNKLSVDIKFDIFACDGADKLKQFLIGCPPKLFGDKTLIGIFDYDEQGIKQVKDNFHCIDEVTHIYKSKSNPRIFAILISPPHPDLKKYQNCPIEFLYTKEVLESFGMISEKRSISEINRFLDACPVNQTDYEKMDSLPFYKLTANKKVYFSENIMQLESREFINFNNIFNAINIIMHHVRAYTYQENAGVAA